MGGLSPPLSKVGGLEPPCPHASYTGAIQSGIIVNRHAIDNMVTPSAALCMHLLTSRLRVAHESLVSLLSFFRIKEQLALSDTICNVHVGLMLRVKGCKLFGFRLSYG